MGRYENGTWRMRNLCRQAIQEFWFQNREIDEVMDVYNLHRGDGCYEHVEKVLLKTRKDFINGFSFFTRNDTDDRILGLMERYGCSCMKD